MKVIVAATHKSLRTIFTIRKLRKNNGRLMENIMLIFTDENYNGKFSSVFSD
jgi:hypothetical protein